MARVRWLNTSVQTAGILTAGFIPPPTGAWDLETDQEPVLTKRHTVHLIQMGQIAFVPQPTEVKRGWSVSTETRFIKPRTVVANMPFSSYVPLPYAIAITNAATGTASGLLHFAALPATVKPGMFVYDLSDPTGTIIPAGTFVVSIVGNDVNISVGVTGVGVANGATIYFTR